MTVTESGYTFNVTAGATPAITANSVNFGNAALNITGYTPDESSPHNASKNVQTVITSSNLNDFNPVVTVVGQASADFLSASAFQDNNDVKVETRLTWNSIDPNREAHGDFTVAAGQTFTLGASLANNTGSNKAITWRGDTLTKLGDGTLVLTANNTYSGLTLIEAGTLHLDNAGLNSDVIVQDTTTLSGSGTLNKNVVFESGSTYLYSIDDNALLTVMGDITIETGANLDITYSGSGGSFQVIAANESQFNGVLFDLTNTWVTKFDQEIRSDGYWINWIATSADFANNVAPCT